MSWVKLDDGFTRNPKARAAGKDGRALYIAALCWSASHLTDGRVPRAVLKLLYSDAEVTKPQHEKLVELGLWEETEDGWQIHDYLVYNRSRREIEKERARWRDYKRGVDRSAVESAVASAVDSTWDSTEPSAVDSAPSRPVPSQEPKGSTDSLTPPVGVEGDGGIANAALLEACLDLEIRHRATGNDPVSDPARWKRTMRKRRWGQWGADIVTLADKFPDAPGDVIAAAIVTGEKQTLRYYANGSSA